jgi:hypothetical protein
MAIWLAPLHQNPFRFCDTEEGRPLLVLDQFVHPILDGVRPLLGKVSFAVSDPFPWRGQADNSDGAMVMGESFAELQELSAAKAVFLCVFNGVGDSTTLGDVERLCRGRRGE